MWGKKTYLNAKQITVMQKKFYFEPKWCSGSFTIKSTILEKKVTTDTNVTDLNRCDCVPYGFSSLCYWAKPQSQQLHVLFATIPNDKSLPSVLSGIISAVHCCFQTQKNYFLSPLFWVSPTAFGLFLLIFVRLTLLFYLLY